MHHYIDWGWDNWGSPTGDETSGSSREKAAKEKPRSVPSGFGFRALLNRDPTTRTFLQSFVFNDASFLPRLPCPSSGHCFRLLCFSLRVRPQNGASPAHRIASSPRGFASLLGLATRCSSGRKHCTEFASLELRLGVLCQLLAEDAKTTNGRFGESVSKKSSSLLRSQQIRMKTLVTPPERDERDIVKIPPRNRLRDTSCGDFDELGSTPRARLCRNGCMTASTPLQDILLSR